MFDRIRRLTPETVGRDLREDRLLRWVLALAAVLCGFWFWYRVPNFAVPDEYTRLIDPMKAAGTFFGDPSLVSLRQGVLDGRGLGASFYLFGLVLVPVFLLVLLRGALGTFVTFGDITSRWTLWFAAPAWFWTACVLVGRLTIVAIAVGCVYLLYRLGVEWRDRTTGRLASIVLTLSFGFVSTAHEIGEDIPMLFVFLLAFLLVLRYVRTGEQRPLAAASLAGGLAIAFKLTAGVIAFVIGGALVYRASTGDEPPRDVARQFGIGLGCGLLAIAVGFPSVLVAGPEPLLERVFGTTGNKSSLSHQRLLWFVPLRQYLSTFGLPLFVAVVAGAGTALARLRRSGITGAPVRAFLLGALAVYLAVFSQWGGLNMHHLLPTVPLFALLIADELGTRIDDPLSFEFSNPTPLRVGLAVLVASSALYTAVGVTFYANEPRQQSTEWLQENEDANTTVEVYENSIADVGVPHSMSVSRYQFNESTAEPYSGLIRNESAYTEWMVSMPDRKPEYIQLTVSELRYLGEPGERFPRRRAYIENLLAGEYEYEVVTRFGERRDDENRLERLFRAGVVPHPEQWTEPVVLLRRTEDAEA
jgi:4-amino-4-deoxy-L-arabinose transferase-like glycosyltransferase